MAVPAAALAAVGQVAGALADLPNKIKGFVDSMAGFVKAVDPAAVEAMNFAMQSLNATIGFALAPVVHGFTQMLREVSGELFAPMNALREVISVLVGEAMNVARPLVAAFGTVLGNAVDTLQSFMPAVKVVTAVLEGLANVASVAFRIYNTVAAALVQGLLGLGGDLTEVVDAVRDAFLRATLAVIRFTDGMLRAFGFSELANKILRGFAAQPQQGRLPALQNVQVTDVRSVYRQRLQAAASAGAGPNLPQQQTDYLKQIRDFAEKQLKASKDIDEKGGGILNLIGKILDKLGIKNPWRDRAEGGG